MWFHLLQKLIAKKVKLTDAKIKAQTKDKLYKLCDDYTDIFSKHTREIGITD